ncbi:hypothetical protein PUV47_12645 [Pseudovibrio exalbescens]|uniref:hypothetical protein n=1 Tax=Pseudovibrio exalbescens TaxID=197461 RepID=UPI00236740BA|nr:hypothetical protein [Pseudovibrio exalbescens]MDD7910767.1 hypothetical protein [Pseudovibrio exalbescens]
MMKLRDIRKLMVENKQLLEEVLIVSRSGKSFKLLSNNQSVLDELKVRLRNLIDPSITSLDELQEIVIFEGEAPELPFSLRRWDQTQQESLRFRDFRKTRVILDGSSGLFFLQNRKSCVVRGACSAHLDDIEKFVCQQFANAFLLDGGVICDATCIRIGDRALAIAGPDWSGANNLIKAMLADPRAQLMTEHSMLLTGKPGLRALAQAADSWCITPSMDGENKHKKAKKKNRAADKAHELSVTSTSEVPLTALVMSTRTDGGEQDIELRRINPLARPGLINSLMVESSPFLQKTDGTFLSPGEGPEVRSYVQQLQNVACYEARIDGSSSDVTQAGLALLGSAA